MSCADCGCQVQRDVRADVCGREGCCCRDLPTQQQLDDIAAGVKAAFEARDMVTFGELLADDARWGDDDAPSKCRTRSDVIATFQRLLGEGVGGEVTETKTGPAGILCRMRIHWPSADIRERRDVVLHLYRVRNGLIVEIEPFDDQTAAEAALAAA